MPHGSTRRQVLAATGGVVTLSGCTRLDPRSWRESDDDGSALHVIGPFVGTDGRRTWRDEIVPGFEDEYGTSVSLEFHHGGRRPRLRTLLENGDPPDLAWTHTREIPEVLLRGDTVTVDDLVESFEEAHGPLVNRPSITANGNVRFVPHGVSLGGTLNYRSDVYDELDLSVPETWDELRENARVIDEAETVDARGFAVSTTGLDKPGDDFTNILYNAGGDYWRWTDEDAHEVAVAFEDRYVEAALEIVRDLAAYSPDPSDLGLGDVIQQWVGGRIAQCFMPNAWLAGIAHEDDRHDGSDHVARHTAQALIPRRDRTVDPPDRGWVRTHGAVVFEDGSNREAATDFLRYLYGRSERHADVLTVDPMRFLPPHEGLLESDTYWSADVFRAEDGRFLEMQHHCLESIAPHLGGDRPRNLATWYARDFGDVSRLVDSVVEGKSIDDEIGRIRDDLAARLEEGRARLASRRD